MGGDLEENTLRKIMMLMILLHYFEDLYLKLIPASGHLQSLGLYGQWTKERSSQLPIAALQLVDILICSGVVLDCMSD